MRKNRDFRKDKGKCNAFLTNYEEDLNNDNNNEQDNHSNNNENDIMQYIMTTHLLNKSFLYLLTAKNVPA